MKKAIIFFLLISILLTLPTYAGSLGRKYPNGDVAFVEAGTIVIDGIKDDAYANGAVFVSDTYRKGFVSKNGTSNTNYLLWDGTYLYIFTEAKDTTLRYVSLSKYITASHDTECIEYFIVWDNSDCPEVETFDPYSSPSLYQYRVCCEPFGHGGWFESASSYYKGFADGAEGTNPFSTRPGEIADGKMIPTSNGYNIEIKITMPESNKIDSGNYEYCDGWKIGFITQQIDWTSYCGDYDNLSIAVSEVGTPSGSVMLRKSTSWDVAYYDYVELEGKPAVVEDVTPVVNVSKVSGKRGGTVEVSIDLDKNTGITGAILNVDYNSALKLVDVKNGDALSSLSFAELAVPYLNPLVLSWDGISDDSSNGNLVTLTFEIPENMELGEYPISVTYRENDVYDSEFNNVKIDVVNGSITVAEYTYGDVNEDGDINGKDLTLIRRHIAGGFKIPNFNALAADVNNDGVINGKDLTLIRRYITGGFGVELGK